MSKEIWERHNYTNHDIGMIINGEIIEYDETEELFKNPKVKKTEDYITGRFG